MSSTKLLLGLFYTKCLYDMLQKEPGCTNGKRCKFETNSNQFELFWLNQKKKKGPALSKKMTEAVLAQNPSRV